MIHITSISYAPREKRADVRVSQKNKHRIHQSLRDELAEEAMSRQLTAQHNERIRQRPIQYWLRD